MTCKGTSPDGLANVVPGVAHNISQGGIMASLYGQFPPHSVVVLDLAAPSEQMAVEARVVWTAPDHEHRSQTKHGFQFLAEVNPDLLLDFLLHRS